MVQIHVSSVAVFVDSIGFCRVVSWKVYVPTHTITLTIIGKFLGVADGKHRIQKTINHVPKPQHNS